MGFDYNSTNACDSLTNRNAPGVYQPGTAGTGDFNSNPSCNEYLCSKRVYGPISAEIWVK